MSSIKFTDGSAPEDARKGEGGVWASPADYEKISSGDPAHDVILADGVSVAFDESRPFEYRRNGNVAVFGGSGHGKTYSVITPNLVTHPDANIVVTDTKGELYRTTARGFVDDGYEVLKFDSVRLFESCGFNPLSYIMHEEDIHGIGKLILDSVSPDRDLAYGDNSIFWSKTEEMLLEALIGILFYLECVDGELAKPTAKAGGRRKYLDFRHLMKIDALLAASDDKMTALSNLMDSIASGVVKESGLDGGTRVMDPDPMNYSVSKFKEVMATASETLSSIIITLHSSLNAFKSKEVIEVLSHDDLRLDELGEGKRIIYIVTSDNDSAYEFLSRMLLKMVVRRLIAGADASPDGRLARHVNLVCDEFANIGRVPDFEKVISIVRSRNISAVLCLQSVAQLQQVYGGAASQIILDCVDTTVFLGSGSSPDTARYISELCGEAPIATQVVGVEHAREDITRKVATASQIATLPRTKCIVKTCGLPPILADKYDLRKHPNYRRFYQE